ncbi:uncharacterized protein LOC135932933 [Pelmatolapia mariae]|uniref:uncharacterized protein LOC135932933 n=1 Tax=Pelmatolapia mariae TaxID=158779 RepID=UPI003211F133
MLVTLCALITALTCVSGVTVLTQKPPVLSVRKGETATMDCNLGTVTNAVAVWHKQIPGGSPQHVLHFHYSSGSPTYGSGFSSPKFTSTHQSITDYRLIINNVEEGDSAVYYCQTWDGSANKWLWGQNVLHVFSGSSLPPPVLTFFPPSSAELQSNTASLVCLSNVSGVTVLTQKPPVLSVRKGETATMDCNLGTVTNSVYWYKQIPGGVPQFVVYFHYSEGGPSYSSGFSSPKFTSTHQSTSDYRLIISNVEEGDSAVYYCET